MVALTRRLMMSASAALLLPRAAAAQSASNEREGADTDWRHYGNDLANTRYAPLDQINASNFNQLEVAWRFKSDNLGPHPEFN